MKMVLYLRFYKNLFFIFLLLDFSPFFSIIYKSDRNQILFLLAATNDNYTTERSS